jgi:hypothetical protein
LSEQEAHILQWNDLPTRVQRKLFEHSIAGVEPRKIPTLKEQIARFLHKHKDDNRERK